MTRLSVLLAAAALAAPASAVQVAGITAPGGNGGTVFEATPGTLSIDFALNAFQPIAVDLLLEAGDEGGIFFDSIIDVFTGVTLGQNLNALEVTLLGGPTFSTIGNVQGFFSNAAVGVAPDRTGFRALFRPSGEAVGVLLGGLLGTTSDFVIAPGQLGPGSSFQLVLTPGAVPEPGTWALLVTGFGLVGFALRRRPGLARA